MNIEDPVDERTFSGIQVTVTHPEIVTNPGNTYQILDDSRTISVTVKAKRSILNKIKTDDIRATADMKNLDVRTRSLIPIDISIPSYAGRFEATANPINLRVSIELGKSETFPITATSSGTPRDGYQVGELKANPEKIKISGPESVIDSIDKVVALVDVSGQSKDEEKEAELISLQAQINPHFLYNTLDTIVWMEEFNDSRRVVDITKSLAQYFRLALNQGQEKILLRDEIDHVRQYLFIQKQR